MIRPQTVTQYDKIDLKLGIKSSLPKVKPTLALLLLLWEANDKPSRLDYSEQNGDKIQLKEEISDKLYSYLCTLYQDIDKRQYEAIIAENLMLNSQLESLIVAFELVWKLAKIRFSDGRSNSSERTGKSRFPKTIWYTINLDLFEVITNGNEEYSKVLVSWLGFDKPYNKNAETNIIQFLTLISESALFKLMDNGKDVVFNYESLYQAMLSTQEKVDVSGDNEAKGSLRILKSLLSENLLSNIEYKGGVSIINREKMNDYYNRVCTYHQLEPCYYEDNIDDSHQIDNLTPEWFREKANDFPDYDEKANQCRSAFLQKYSIDFLKSLSGKELLTSIFLNNENKENLCYRLEFDSDLRDYFGSIKSGNAYKYGLHYSQKNDSWATGSALKPEFLDEQTAIDLGTRIRDNLVAGAEIVENTKELNSIDDYLELFSKLYAATDGYVNKIWFVKYYQMLKPDLFPPIYSEKAQKTVCEAINEKPNENSLCRMAQIRFYANECSISNILFSKVFWTYATSIINDESVGDIDMSGDAKQVCTYDSQTKSKYLNLIVYGTPGCGKSYYVKNELLKDYEEKNIVRTTFYQDYTNTDFVGQILPVVSGNNVTYKFNPGPFTLALEKAVAHPEEKVALVIEELNRGNAPSIFGDIFQLLDREGGKSEYEITNVNVQKYLTEVIPEQLFVYIKIPANLSIIATMNTSDQNVFTLDTAFKRRWEFKKLKNTFKESHPYKDYFVPGMGDFTWKSFVDDINSYIVAASSDLQSEDKHLGVFFVSKDLLCEKPDDCSEEKSEKFAYKVLEYLWNDVAKFDRENWFNDNIKSLDELVEEYVKSGKEVFKDGIFRKHNS